MSPRARRRLRLGGASLLLGLVILNLLAYHHARALTSWAPPGPRTSRPEDLSFGEKLSVLFAGARIPKPQNLRTPEDVGLAYERHVFRAPDGIALEAWHVPHPASRGLVLMFHGYADRKESVLPQGAAFHDLGWSLLMVDFRGSGGSGGSETSLGFHEARDVAAAFEHAGRLAGSRPRVLFGASMGAAAALKAVGEGGPAPDALVLESPFDSLLHTVRRRCRSLGLPGWPVAELLVFWGGLQRGFNGFRHNPAEYAAGVRAPVLLMHGDRDDRISTEEALAVFTGLKGPKSFKVFRGLGHESFVKARPEEWRSAVSGFLDGLEGPKAERGSP